MYNENKSAILQNILINKKNTTVATRIHQSYYKILVMIISRLHLLY